VVLQLCDGAERPRRDRRQTGNVGQGEDGLLDLWRKPKHAHDLGHPGTGDFLSTGNVSLR